MFRAAVLLSAVAACGGGSPPCTPFDVTAPTASMSMDVIWTGNEYITVAGSVSANQPQDSVVQIFDANGRPGPVIAKIAAADGLIVKPQNVAWTGDQLAVVVARPADLSYDVIRYKLDGTTLGSTHLTSMNQATLVWANDHFVIASLPHGSGNIGVVEMSRDGVLGTPVELASPSSGFQLIPVLTTWNGKIAIGAIGNGAPYLGIYDPMTHAATFHQLDLDLNNATVYSLVDREGQLVAYGGTKFQKIGTDGTPSTAIVEPMPSDDARMVATPTGFRVYNSVSAGGMGSYTATISTIDLDPDGTAVGAPQTLFSVVSGGGGELAATNDGNRNALFLTYAPQVGAAGTLRLIQQCK